MLCSSPPPHLVDSPDLGQPLSGMWLSYPPPYPHCGLTWLGAASVWYVASPTPHCGLTWLGQPLSGLWLPPPHIVDSPDSGQPLFGIWLCQASVNSTSQKLPAENAQIHLIIQHHLRWGIIQLQLQSHFAKLNFPYVYSHMDVSVLYEF